MKRENLTVGDILKLFPQNGDGTYYDKDMILNHDTILSIVAAELPTKLTYVADKYDDKEYHYSIIGTPYYLVVKHYKWRQMDHGYLNYVYLGFSLKNWAMFRKAKMMAKCFNLPIDVVKALGKKGSNCQAFKNIITSANFVICENETYRLLGDHASKVKILSKLFEADESLTKCFKTMSKSNVETIANFVCKYWQPETATV